VNPIQSVPPPVLAASVAATALGVPLGLYALLTRGQRRTRREIRHAAKKNGWEYHRRRWQGNPAAFRIDGRTPDGLPWKLTSGNRGYDGPDWTTELVLRFPTLGGDTDVAVVPRDQEHQGTLAATNSFPEGVHATVARFSRTVAAAVRFMGNAQEILSGQPRFDSRYQVLVSPNANRLVVDAALAGRILQWPDALAVHSIVGWRDPYGFVLEARLPGPPNWATVAYFLTLGSEVVAHLPPATISAVPESMVDRLVGRLVR